MKRKLVAKVWKSNLRPVSVNHFNLSQFLKVYCSFMFLLIDLSGQTKFYQNSEKHCKMLGKCEGNSRKFPATPPNFSRTQYSFSSKFMIYVRRNSSCHLVFLILYAVMLDHLVRHINNS